MGKEENIESVPPPTWDELLERVSPVAKPLASRKLCKRVNKLLSNYRQILNIFLYLIISKSCFTLGTVCNTNNADI